MFKIFNVLHFFELSFDRRENKTGEGWSFYKIRGLGYFLLFAGDKCYISTPGGGSSFPSDSAR